MRTDTEWKAFDGLAAKARQEPGRVEKMTYRAPGTLSVPAAAGGGDPAAGDARALADGARIAALEQRLERSEESAQSGIEAARQEGREALDQARRQIELQEKTAREQAGQIAAALAGFAAERDQYFAQAEREVVRLALAIAARILNREALLDPLLLAGAVRVALGQLGETTGTRLRCPAEEAESWRELLRGGTGAAPAAEIVGDPALASGECVLEASVGSVDLGVRAQLAEIERGFFDLLERRPGVGRDREGK